MRKLALLALVLTLWVQAASAVDAVPPPMPAADEVDGPEVRIQENRDVTVTEYRSHGKLYMIKVTPKNAPAYYLVDSEGRGRFDRSDNPAQENSPVPRWILFEF